MCSTGSNPLGSSSDPVVMPISFGSSRSENTVVPQVVNAERYRLDLAPYPTITRIFEACMKLDAFAAAHPQRQPDFEP